MRGSLAQLKLSPHPALSLRSGSTFSQREKGPTANFITEKPRTRFILNRTAVPRRAAPTLHVRVKQVFSDCWG